MVSYSKMLGDKTWHFLYELAILGNPSNAQTTSLEHLISQSVQHFNLRLGCELIGMFALTIQARSKKFCRDNLFRQQDPRSSIRKQHY